MVFAAFEVARRWRNTSIVHPMVWLRVGSVHAEYDYYHTVNGVSETHTDGTSTTHFVAPAVGAEVSLFKYMTAYAAVSRRFAGRLNTPGLESGGLSSTSVSFGMGFGKFR
jgi:hypothetical protein